MRKYLVYGIAYYSDVYRAFCPGNYEYGAAAIYFNTNDIIRNINFAMNSKYHCFEKKFFNIGNYNTSDYKFYLIESSKDINKMMKRINKAEKDMENLKLLKEII